MFVDLTIVVPAFNEASRIEPLLAQLAAYQASSARRVEVIVVDDGSTDGTVDLVETHRSRIANLSVIALADNSGKGAAVAAGMLAGRGAYRVFLDADGATPVSEVDALWAAATEKARSVAIGSVACAGAKVRRHQPFARRIAGRMANRIIRLLVLPGIHDTQRGAKLFPAEIADAVFSAQASRGWAFDIEILARCRSHGYRIVEVPVEWHHVDGGQIGAGDYLATFRELLAIRRRIKALPSTRAVPALRRAATGLAPLQRHAS
jgi:dolichyl-phosphate beta-glucosyltransferase